MNKIPVTLITGFLGSGKTSLLTNLIDAYPNKRFAIIENEFGETNIDSELVRNVQTDDIYELSNGCICCSLNGELYHVLKKLIQSDRTFNHLLIETTGIADPGAVLSPFVTDPFIKKEFVIDSVICLIDAENANSLIRTEKILTKQIAISDKILVNKTDLAGKEKSIAIKKGVKKINAFATIEECTFAKTSNPLILDSYSYAPEKVYEFIFRLETSLQNDKELEHDIDSMLFTSQLPIDQLKLGMWLDAFLKFNQDSIFRIKGILYLHGVDHRIILQSVHTQIQTTVGKMWENESVRENKIVIIGKNLNKSIIEKNLQDLLIK